MPIDSKAGNGFAHVSKVQIKGVTMATSHRSLPPGTCHTAFSVANECTYLDTGSPPPPEPRGGWEGANQGKRDKATQSKMTRAKLHSNDSTVHA